MNFTGFAVVRIEDEKEIPQGLDYSSGGYPYDATHINAVHVWASESLANRYVETMNGKHHYNGVFATRLATLTIANSN